MNCNNYNVVGAHVGMKNDDNMYLAPLCSSHNSRKRNAGFMDMETNAELVEIPKHWSFP